VRPVDVCVVGHHALVFSMAPLVTGVHDDSGWKLDLQTLRRILTWDANPAPFHHPNQVS
jgi:hypothetical protein